MQLIRDSVVCYPNLGREDVSIYVPHMKEKDRKYFQDYGKNHKTYWGSRHNDYFWASYWLNWWCRNRRDTIRLLDLGCGNSLWPHYVREQYPDSYVKGIDVPKYVDLLTAAVSNFDLDVNGVENFAFSRAEFNVVTSISAFEHFNVDKKLLVGKMVKTLKPGGLLLITTDFWFKEHDKNLPRATTFGTNSLSEVFGLTEEEKTLVAEVTQLPQYSKTDKEHLLHLGFVNE